MVMFLYAHASLASAPATPLLVKSPLYGGEWDRFGIADPSYHHTPWGGDWALDEYGDPGDLVRFRIRELDPAATAGKAYGVIETNWSSCASPYDWAGTAYQIGVYDGDGNHVGWVLYAHVDTSAVGLLPIGTVVGYGTILGTIEQYAWSSCYQVVDPAGVHTHVEVYNDSDYACYEPYYAGTLLYPRDTLGEIGSSNAGPQEPCY